MVAERLIKACSKLATTRLWHTTTLAEELGVQDAQVDDSTPPSTGSSRDKHAKQPSWPLVT